MVANVSSVKTDALSAEHINDLSLEYAVKFKKRVSQRRVVKAALVLIDKYRDEYEAILRATE